MLITARAPHFHSSCCDVDRIPRSQRGGWKVKLKVVFFVDRQVLSNFAWRRARRGVSQTQKFRTPLVGAQCYEGFLLSKTVVDQNMALYAVPADMASYLVFDFLIGSASFPPDFSPCSGVLQTQKLRPRPPVTGARGSQMFPFYCKPWVGIQPCIMCFAYCHGL